LSPYQLPYLNHFGDQQLTYHITVSWNSTKCKMCWLCFQWR